METISLKDDPDLNLLWLELRRTGLLGCAILVAGFLLLALFQSWMPAARWLVQAALLWSVVYWQVRKRLVLNRSEPDAPLYSTLGWGNRITILRGGLISLSGGFLFMAPEEIANLWLPAIFYMTAAIIDRIDGFVARRSGRVSMLGAELDTVFDALGLVVAPLLAVWLGKVHWGYLSVSSAWYLFQWGLSWRRRHDLPVHDLVPNSLRRSLAGFQMGFLAVALWPVIHPPLTIIAGWAFMLPILAGFIIDWCVASGRIHPQSARAFYNWLNGISAKLFQPVLRLLLLTALFLVIRNAGMNWWMIFDNSLFERIVSIAILSSVCMMAMGLAGRLAALVMIVLLGWQFPGNPATFTGTVLIVSCIWIMLLGTGRFSLWQWDDDWVNRYDGA